MKIHHLNCGTLCPITGSFIGKKLSFLNKWTGLVCHCLLIETDNNGLILIDTGLGVKDVVNDDRFFTHLLFKNFAKPVLDIKETAFHQIVKMGFSPKDVQHIIVTHLDVDHVGGLADFPDALVHVHESEWELAFGSKSFMNSTRYLPEQFSHNVKWKKYSNSEAEWKGFKSIVPLENISQDIALIHLPGHTSGHSGVYIKDSDNELFFVGDAYLNRNQLIGKNYLPYIKIYNQLFQMDKDLFFKNLEALSKIQKENKNINVFCSHDYSEFECLCQHKKLPGT